MDIHQMEYFIAVCDYGGFTPAAEALFLTPQAMSKSIRKLEEELDAPLFTREKKGLSLTPFGEKVVEEFRRLVSDYRASRQRLTQIAVQEKGLIRLACAFGVPNAFPLEALRQELLPEGITLDIMELPDLLIEDMVRQEIADLGLSVGLPEDPQLCQYTFLRRYQLCAVVNMKHPLARRKSISVRDLAGEQVITKSPYFRSYHMVEEEAARQGVKLSYAHQSPDELRYLRLLENNAGIGIGVTFMDTPALRASPNTVVLPFEEDLPWEVYLLTRKGHYLSQAAQRLLSRLQSWQSPEP